ncbi:MAG: gfo/Idh/MocA family oxidoreductase [Armatimonadetes bacterium]|nr:gfo/Idh/MocA family oxidoreductase [Armatimonadota bacterium]
MVNQSPTQPRQKFPIVCVGAGGIMRNAHLPAYRMCGFEAVSIIDTKPELARQLAQEFDIPFVAESLDQLIAEAPSDAIYDLAVPPDAHADILRKLPDHSHALLQKPMGETLNQAEEILRVCDEKNIRAAVNFQLRWAPYTLALKSLLDQGALGELLDLEFKVNVHTPWAGWPFLELAPRMEMVYHSIHYTDLTRDLLGEPHKVWARAIKHPDAPKLESTRSCLYFEYGDQLRATINTYHAHKAGPKHQQSYLKLEGTKGVAWFQMGLNLNYPKGGADIFEYWLEGDSDWTPVPLEGGWFPHAFRGPMSAMMDWQAGGDAPSTEVHQAILTMRLVEEAYRCSDLMAE